LVRAGASKKALAAEYGISCRNSGHGNRKFGDVGPAIVV